VKTVCDRSVDEYNGELAHAFEEYEPTIRVA
jgi:hypothetical protein